MSILTLSITLTPLMLNTSDSTIDRYKQLERKEEGNMNYSQLDHKKMWVENWKLICQNSNH